jgi:5'(3')-deoxyribonucleotidase
VIVLCDVDGVTADYVGGVLDTVFELFGRQVFRQEIKQWDLFCQLGLDKRQLSQLYRELDNPGWCSALQPLPGAKEFITELRDRGHTIHVVTSSWLSAPAWDHERRTWLKDHFKIQPHQVTFTSEKERVIGDILIDDRARHVCEWQRAHPTGQALLFSQSYNEREEGLRRVRGYGEVLAAIDEHEGKILKCQMK